MGLQILEEFHPITPIRTLPLATTFTHRTDLSEPELLPPLNEDDDDDEECLTPRSPARTLRTPLVCPPAPKKPRLAPRSILAPPSQGFFQVPHDLASVFVLLTETSNKKKMSTDRS